MSLVASQITSVTIVYSTVCSGADQRKYQSSASLAFVRGIHRWPVNSPHKWPVTRKMFPFDDVIMIHTIRSLLWFVAICYQWVLPIAHKVTPMALGQSYDCPSATDATLGAMGKDALNPTRKTIQIIWDKMTSSNGNIFRVASPLWGEFTGHREFPSQRPATRSFDFFLWSGFK